METVRLNVEILKDSKKIYIGTDISSGCEYDFENANDIGEIVTEYLQEYENIK